MFSLVLSKFLAMRNITSYTAVYLAGVSKSVHWLIDYDKLLIKRGHRNSFIYPLFIYLRNPEGSSTTLFCKHFNSQTYVKSRIMDGALRIQIYHSQSWMACFSQKLVNATTTIVDRCNGRPWFVRWCRQEQLYLKLYRMSPKSNSSPKLNMRNPLLNLYN